MTPAMKRMQARLGCSLEEALRQVATSSESQADVARRWGVPRSTIAAWCKRLGIKWRQDPQYRWSRDAKRRVKVGGEWMTIKQAARSRGLPVGAVDERWQQGDRTARRLLRPLNAYVESYELGLTVAEWDWILAYAKERGKGAAAKKFGVPEGAVRLALEGHWEMVA